MKQDTHEQRHKENKLLRSIFAHTHIREGQALLWSSVSTTTHKNYETENRSETRQQAQGFSAHLLLYAGGFHVKDFATHQPPSEYHTPRA